MRPGDQTQQNTRILLVDDDHDLRASLAEQLELYDEFTTEQASSGTRALEIATSEHFDLILLDVGLPDLDGREVCRKLREAGITVPIMMLTAHDTASDTLLGLDSGANYYMTKPVKLTSLMAQMRVQLRQHGKGKPCS